jgi:hypothetical protein
MRMVRRGAFVACICAICLLLFVKPTMAQQNTADVVGTVTDSTGAVIPNATVTITNVGTNISQTVTSAENGDYTFTLLQVGTYSLKVESNGFKTFSVPNIALSSGDRARVDAKMEVGNVTQSVEVSGSVAPALQTDTSSLGTLVTKEAVQDIPLNGRNVTKLIQLSVGVGQGGTNSVASGTRPDDRRQTDAFSANGQDDAVNNNLLDGIDNNERIIGGNLARPSVDAIQEVNVSTNMYDASVGRTGGGVVNVITKAGTNNFHGTLYEFFRNRVLNTNPGYAFPSSFSNGVEQFNTVLPKPSFRQNQYGASLGGPIRKNKTFFFGDFERFGYAAGTPFSISVPTACERGTTLVALQAAAEHVTAPSVACGVAGHPGPTGDGTSPVNPGDFSDVAAVSAQGGGTRACTTTPTGSTPANLINGTPGNGNCPYVVLPTNSSAPYLGLDKLGLEYFSMYPLPNGPGTINNYSSTPAKTQQSQTFDGRIDQQISASDSFYGHFTINNITSLIPQACPEVNIDTTTGMVAANGVKGVAVIPGCGGGSPGTAASRQEFVGTNYVHIFNPNLVLNLKLGVVHSKINSFDVDWGTNVSNALGFPCNTTPNVVSAAGSCINTGTQAEGLASITLAVANPANGTNPATPTYTGFGSSGFLPILEYDTNFIYMAQLNWNKGAHSIKIGGGAIRRRATIGKSNSANGGGFAFTGAYTGVPAADLLMSLATTESRNYATYNPSFRYWEPSTYIQDDWRIKRWLTLNLGLRYDIFTPQEEVHDRQVNFSATSGLYIGPSLPGAQHTGRSAGVNTDYHDLAPRFGFSASLHHDMVIRGGFGLTFFPINYESGYSLQNPPSTLIYSCALQTANQAQNSCVGTPYNNGATARFGTNSGGGSVIGQTGGWLFNAGEPAPFVSTNSVLQPSSTVCSYSGTLANYATTCPFSSDPYQASSISNDMAPGLSQEYLEQANLTLQKAFGQNVVSVGGVIELGRHAPKGLALNSISNPSQVVGGANTSPLGEAFPWLAKTSVSVNNTVASNAYSSLQLTYVRRFTKGLTAQVNYAWAHALSYSGGACTPTKSYGPGDTVIGLNPCFYDNPANPGSPFQVNWFNKGFDLSNTGYDIADRLGWTLNYELPFAKSLTGVGGVILKGWATNLAGSWQTGIPFTVGENVNGLNGIGTTAGNPDQVCSGRLSHHTTTQWFNPACFESQTPGTFGNEQGGQLMGPDLKNLDFSLFKEFVMPVKEDIRLQFRTEVFNLFNTPNFGVPTNITVQYTGCTPSATTRCTGDPNPMTDGLTGAITSLNPGYNSRQIQFALKILF